MTRTRDIGRQRLAAQALCARTATTPAALVTQLGAMQAQDYHACHWAVGMRMAGDDVTVADVERALADGALLRTHAMRGTWQLMTPADAAWILPLVAPNVLARSATRHRQLGLDDAILQRGGEAMARALERVDWLDRAGLRDALAADGIDATGERLAHILGAAELAGVVCSAGGHGATSRTMLLARRLPKRVRRLARAEAAAQLAQRYFESRGPATLDDFVWWSGLPVAEARAALEAVRGELVAHEDAGGRTRWHRRGLAPAARAPRALLVPAFDEFLVAYRKRDEVLDPADVVKVNAGGGLLNPVVVLDGYVVGAWKRTLGRTDVTVNVRIFRRLASADESAIKRAAARYAAFLGRPLELDVRLRA
ncbi:MAG TPA: winged helix DNA-binding domain-containing protein [Kofleriaceae bacterium]|nr:winged helix DNA-binding domain-containing protein [Kofleriaceae bacterium]